MRVILNLILIVIIFLSIIFINTNENFARTVACSSYNFICTFGHKGSGPGEFFSPSGVAVDTSGYIYVADTNNDRIQKLDSSGEFILELYHGEEPHVGFEEFKYVHFYRPKGVAIDIKGNIFVADTGNNYIHKFAPDGNFIYSFFYSDFLTYPIGIAVDTESNVIIANTVHNNIVRIISGKISSFGCNGKDDGQFNYPEAVASDIYGNIIVADSNNCRIQKFDFNGNFITKFGSQGTEDGQFNCARSVAVDREGCIYVLDAGNNRVQKFDSNGKFITQFRSKRKEDGQFYFAEGIAVDNDGNIYVVDSGNHRIQKFTPNSEFKPEK